MLNFAYKDCILKGGQSRDEDKSQEIFFNEILAKDEIDVLFDKKVLYKFESIGGGGMRKSHITSSLKATISYLSTPSRKKYAKQVKLIYIDPPYNTGNDSFNYKDRFNHSTWLTFMKNRLEVAKEFLRGDGVIFTQCNDNEQAYLKVLMDEIFGRENFVGCCPIIINGGGRDYGGIAKTHEYVLIFKKTELLELNLVEDVEKKIKFQDSFRGFDLMELRNRNTLFSDKNRPNLYYPFYLNPYNKDENGLLELSLDKQEDLWKFIP